MAFKMTVFKIWIYQDARITVEKVGETWQVWGEKQDAQGEWVGQPVHFAHTERVIAMIAAYQFAEKFLRNIEGLDMTDLKLALRKGVRP